MKILAIRGRNLASLAGDFALDFTLEPLAGAGLFTIVGETGAGKSTILDALCLALYGDFPRLQAGEGREKIEDGAGERIEVSDPRSILRSGAVEGVAEAEIEIGSDRLLARWRVWRARGKVEGALQPADRSLIDLGRGETIASGKTSVEREIAARLGLSYEQFRRTVLLAQNQFDAFLRANDAERADILEHITGTELYSRLSRAAFDAEKAARLTLDELSRAGKAIAVLGADERAALDAGIATAETHRLGLVREESDLRRIVDIHARAGEAQLRAHAAEEALAVAKEALTAADGDRQLLVRLETLLPLQPLLLRAGQAVADLAASETEQAALRRDAEERGQRRQLLAQALAASMAELDSAEAEQQRLTPLIDAAMKLDHESVAAEAAAKDLQRQQQAAAAEAAQAGAERDQVEQQLAALATERTRLAADIGRRQGYAGLATAGEDMPALFAELAARLSAASNLTASLARLRDECSAVEARVADAQTRRTALSMRLAEARRLEGEKAELLAAMEPDVLRRRRDALAQLADLAGVLTRHLEEEAERRKALADAEAVIAASGATQEQSEVARRELAAQLAVTEVWRREEQSSLALSQTLIREEVIGLRSGLIDGEPCPVCGAREHPGHDDAVARQLVEKLRLRCAELDEEKDAIEARLAALRDQVEGAKAEQRAAVQQASLARQKIAALAQRGAALIGQVSAQAVELLPQAGTASDQLAGLDGVERLVRVMTAARDELGRRLDKAALIDGERQATVRRVLSLEAKLSAEATPAAADSAERQRLADLFVAAEKETAVADERRDAALDQLAARLAPAGFSRDDLLRDPSGVGTRFAAELAAYRDLLAQEQQTTRQLAELQPRRSALGERFTQLAARREMANAQISAAQQALVALRKARAGYFDGKQTGVVRDEAAALVAAARGRKAEAELALRELTAGISELEKALERLLDLLVQRRALAKQLSDERAAALQRAGISLAEAETLAAMDETERNTRRQHVKSLETAHSEAASTALDRRRHADAMRTEQNGVAAEEETQARLAVLTGELTALSERLGSDRQRLVDDDQACARRLECDRDVAAAERRQLDWAAVSEAIGSHDGSRFRRFAQAVTLDHLVHLANEQLRSINPRYRIERPQEGGLALQVADLEMGGERRSVRSLSGGERFLVSLALALALSRLDGGVAYVDTLLIDEGFGSLDARALDIAVEALERLESEGRRVGVISHVEALKERIPVQVVVERQGDGRSRVRIAGPDFGM